MHALICKDFSFNSRVLSVSLALSLVSHFIMFGFPVLELHSIKFLHAIKPIKLISISVNPSRSHLLNCQYNTCWLARENVVLLLCECDTCDTWSEKFTPGCSGDRSRGVSSPVGRSVRHGNHGNELSSGNKRKMEAPPPDVIFNGLWASYLLSYLFMSFTCELPDMRYKWTIGFILIHFR